MSRRRGLDGSADLSETRERMSVPRIALLAALASFAPLGCGGSSSSGSASDGGGSGTDADGLGQGGSVGNDAKSTSDDAGEDSSTPRPDASPPSDGGAGSACMLTPVEPPDGAVGCNQVTAVGPLIQETCSDAGAPTPHGGTIVDGTYVLESATYYGVCPTAPNVTQDRVTWVLCGDQWQSTQIIGTMRSSFNVVAGPGDAGAASIVITETCPVATAFGRSYDVTPGHLAFFFRNGASLEVDTYMRQ